MQGPQYSASNNSNTLKFVFQLSICDVHFDVYGVWPMDGWKVAEDVLCTKWKSWLSYSTHGKLKSRRHVHTACHPCLLAWCSTLPVLDSLSWAAQLLSHQWSVRWWLAGWIACCSLDLSKLAVTTAQLSTASRQAGRSPVAFW